MIFAILASFAAEERRVITGRTLAGKKEKASRDGFAGGAAPLGYKRDLQRGLVVDTNDAQTVRQVVNLRATGCSLQAIATALNNAGVKPKRGSKFHPSTIRYMLGNPSTAAGTNTTSATTVKCTASSKVCIRQYYPSPA